jgi:serine/threonine protein kinase
MSDSKFERFGKYLILDHLVDGGMAKICRARFLGEQSNKILAIKMVQPQFSRDPSFVRMFQDELSVTFGLQHPNIAQTYDYGKVNDQLYTAMEYVDGANLKQFLDRLKEKKFVFPVEISVFIISQVCQGLNYAHTYTDKLTGLPLNIIHRDISPHNIMLTYDGSVKVIDFGIAKSNASSEATQAGTIKGKLSYLAPEYLEGLELDCRYDQFAVGITLWEMLCSRKMFTAANDLAVLKQIQACKIAPPSSINPNVPKELDEIVMKALSKDRSERFDNLDKMNRALVKFLYSKYPDFNPSDLSYFAQQLFKDEIKSDKAKFVEYGKIDVQPYIDDMSRTEKNPAPAAPQPFTGKTDEPTRQERIELDLGEPVAEPGEGTASIELALPNKTSTRKVVRQPVNQGPKTLTGQKVVSIPNASKKVAPADRSMSSKTSITSKTAIKTKKQMVIETETTSGGGVKIIILIAASVMGLAYFQPEFIEDLTGINVRYLMGEEVQDRSISSVDTTVADKKKPMKKAEMGQLKIDGFDFGMELYLDGLKREYLQGANINLPLDTKIKVVVRKTGHKSFVRFISLSENNRVMTLAVPELQRAKLGLLSSSLNYTNGSLMKIKLEDEILEQRMPFKNISIPEGKYNITIVNPDLGTEKNVEMTIEENKVHFLE